MLNRILFIGLGGAGQRHLRLFKKLDGENVEFIAYRSTKKTPLLNSDFTVNEKGTFESLYNLKTFDNINKALELKPNLAVISTPSSMHLEYAQLCADHNINIFVEKPLTNSLDGIQKLKETVKKNKVAIHVGFQRRFHPHLRKIKNILESGKLGRVFTANFTVASYIPRWHPYEDYLKLYACRKDLGGGVLLTEIHEIDLAVWYFGVPSSVVCIGGTYSNVGIDVEDTVKLILDYVSFSVQINLTFWQKHHQRSFEINADKGYISWNQEDDILIEKYFDNPDKNIVRQNPKKGLDAMFESQIDLILNNFDSSNNINEINNSLISLQIVEAAKSSMETNNIIMLKNI